MPRRVRTSSLELTLIASALWLVLPAATHADERAQVIHPWHELEHGLLGSFSFPTVLLHVSAVVVTPQLVWTVDRPVQEYFQEHDPASQRFADVTLAVGWVAPVLLPLGLYLGGLAGDSSELATAGAAALQAAAVQALFVTTLKYLTDRAGPYPDGDPTRARWSKGLFRDSDDPDDFDWNPFDIAGGLRWPSGHTSSNIALVSALLAFYPDRPLIALVGYPIALAIGVGMIEGDFHWFSDVIAGGLIGHAIGWTIGKHFRGRYDAERAGCGEHRGEPGDCAADGGGAGLELSIQPLASPRGGGLALVGRF